VFIVSPWSIAAAWSAAWRLTPLWPAAKRNMNPWALLIVWSRSQSLQIVFGVQAVRQQTDTNRNKRIGSLVASGFASVIPLMTLLLFLRVFVIGESSNVAQLAGESGIPLWRLWFQAWPLLFFGNPVEFFVNAVTALFPPYPPKYWQSFTSRVCGVIATGFACYVVVIFFPDA
jgi:hypothetical protein